MGRDKHKGVFLATVDISDPGIADALNGILQHGLERRLKIAGRTAYNVEQFRRGGFTRATASSPLSLSITA